MCIQSPDNHRFCSTIPSARRNVTKLSFRPFEPSPSLSEWSIAICICAFTFCWPKFSDCELNSCLIGHRSAEIGSEAGGWRPRNRNQRDGSISTAINIPFGPQSVCRLLLESIWDFFCLPNRKCRISLKRVIRDKRKLCASIMNTALRVEPNVERHS